VSGDVPGTREYDELFGLPSLVDEMDARNVDLICAVVSCQKLAWRHGTVDLERVTEDVLAGLSGSVERHLLDAAQCLLSELSSRQAAR
jgi:hypothetical protein